MDPSAGISLLVDGIRGPRDQGPVVAYLWAELGPRISACRALVLAHWRGSQLPVQQCRDPRHPKTCISLLVSRARSKDSWLRASGSSRLEVTN